MLVRTESRIKVSEATNITTTNTNQPCDVTSQKNTIQMPQKYAYRTHILYFASLKIRVLKFAASINGNIRHASVRKHFIRARVFFSVKAALVC